MDISVVIPLFNEEESLPELYAWIERVMQANGFSFEVIFVNDGSTDHSWEVIEKLKAQSEHVKGIKFRRNYGKSPALYCGFAEAEGNVVITMDADLQDSPDEIPELYRMITKDGYDLVSGWKQKRYDPISKTLPTKLFNATARKVSGIKNLHLAGREKAVGDGGSAGRRSHRILPDVPLCPLPDGYSGWCHFGSCLWMGGSMARKESRATNGHPAELKKKKRPLCSSLLYSGLFCYEADPLI